MHGISQAVKYQMVLDCIYKMDKVRNYEACAKRAMAPQYTHITDAMIKLEPIRFMGSEQDFGGSFLTPEGYTLGRDHTRRGRQNRKWVLEARSRVTSPPALDRLVDGDLMHIGLAIIHGLEIGMRVGGAVSRMTPSLLSFDGDPGDYHIIEPDDIPTFSGCRPMKRTPKFFDLPPEVLT